MSNTWLVDYMCSIAYIDTCLQTNIVAGNRREMSPSMLVRVAKKSVRVKTGSFYHTNGISKGLTMVE